MTNAVLSLINEMVLASFKAGLLETAQDAMLLAENIAPIFGLDNQSAYDLVRGISIKAAAAM